MEGKVVWEKRKDCSRGELRFPKINVNKLKNLNLKNQTCRSASMKKLIVLALLFCLHHFAIAQAYDTAFGLRLGTEWGLTIKQRIAKRTTLEGIIQSSVWRNETTISLLGEQHFPILFRNLNIYGGGGLHKGWAGNNAEYGDPFGLTLIGGAELALGRFNVSWDLKPSINVTGGESPVYAHTGLSVRYVIDKRQVTIGKTEAEKKKRQRQKDRRKRKRQKEKDKRKGEQQGINWKFWENW